MRDCERPSSAALTLGLDENRGRRVESESRFCSSANRAPNRSSSGVAESFEA